MAVLRNESRAQYTVVNQTIIRDDDLSLKALGLLVKLLSMPDNWKFSEMGLDSIFKKDGRSSIRSGLKELEDLGYLSRTRIRDEGGKMGDAEWIIRETPLKTAPNLPMCENQTLDKPMCEKPMYENPTLENPMLENRTQSITKELNTKKPITKSIYQSKEMMDKIDRFREKIRENISFDGFMGQEEVAEIVEIMTEVVTSTTETIRVGKEDKPTAVVAEQMLKLDNRHISYVMECMNQNTKPIKNIRAYLLTALYNAPNTMNSHYKAEAQSDLFGGVYNA